MLTLAAARSRANRATPAAVYDSNWGNVLDYLKFDEASGTTFADQANNTFTAFGSAAGATTYGSPFSPSGAAMVLPSAGSYLLADNGLCELRYSAFTLEGFVYLPALPPVGNSYCLVSTRPSGGTASGLRILVANDGSATASAWNSSGSAFGAITTSAGAFTAGAWHHVAYCRSGASWYLLVDGTLAGTGSSAASDSVGAPGNKLCFGRDPSNTSLDAVGAFSSWRFTVGVCRYTASTAAPTSYHSSLLSADSDPLWAQVASLVYGLGGDGQQSLIDQVLPAWVIANGSPGAVLPVSSYQDPSAASGVSSNGFGQSDNTFAWFGGGGRYINTLMGAIGDQDFTLEFLIAPGLDSGSAYSYGRMFELGPNATAGGLWVVRSGSSNPVGVLAQVYGSGYSNISAGSPAITFPNSVWHSYALCRDGNTYNHFYDGVLSDTITNATGHNLTQLGMHLGGNNVGGEFMRMRLQNFRLTVGTARYASDYTPQFSPFPNHG